MKRQLARGAHLFKEQCSQFMGSLLIERDFPAESQMDLLNWEWGGWGVDIHVNSKLALDNGIYFLFDITAADACRDAVGENPRMGEDSSAPSHPDSGRLGRRCCCWRWERVKTGLFD